MGRVLPGLTTRTGATSVADALGTTKDQQLQNALRRAAFQKQEERKTPEGMLKFVGQAAQTAGKVASAAKGIGSLVGSIPLPEALRSAAAAKATSQMVMPKVQESIETVVREQGIGQGAPVTAETAETIETLSGQGQQGRLAAAALGRQAERDREMRSFRDRSAAAESEVEQLEPYMLPTEKAEDLAAEEVTEQAMRATQEAEQFVDEATQQQRQAEQQAVQESLSGVAPATEEDVERIQLETVVQGLGASDAERQERLVSMARTAYTPEAQRQILDAATMIDVAPTRVSDLFDTRGGFQRQIMKEFPSQAQSLQALRAAATADRFDRRLVQRREIETERQNLKSNRLQFRKDKAESDAELADKRYDLDAEKVRIRIDREFKRREEWAYNQEFKERKHKDYMAAKEATRKLRRTLGNRRIGSDERRFNESNFRNLNSAIKGQEKATGRLSRELTGSIKKAQSSAARLNTDKIRYQQKIQRLKRADRRQYERSVLNPNGGKDPVIVDLDEQIKNANDAVTALKTNKKNADQAIKKFNKIGIGVRKWGASIPFEKGLLALDEVDKIAEDLDINVFTEGENDGVE